ncbi:hypothetical protein EB796_003893 [Bugula neritina]|uniref:Uncharacterized protein n=1 Tax=Bugula neritina TaxID=10212 RepID=A0A7J7KHS9_BUGNE|nr:hypothetical protein EB796_003893 [Bugula neritina]
MLEVESRFSNFQVQDSSSRQQATAAINKLLLEPRKSLQEGGQEIESESKNLSEIRSRLKDIVTIDSGSQVLAAEAMKKVITESVRRINEHKARYQDFTKLDAPRRQSAEEAINQVLTEFKKRVFEVESRLKDITVQDESSRQQAKEVINKLLQEPRRASQDGNPENQSNVEQLTKNEAEDLLYYLNDQIGSDEEAVHSYNSDEYSSAVDE